MIYGCGRFQKRELLKLSYLSKDQYNKPIYAFAYQEYERTTKYFCYPVKGMIIDDHFYEFKKDGKTLKKNGVILGARYFADTYEEAVKGFNQLINERVEKLNDEIIRAKELLIDLHE